MGVRGPVPKRSDHLHGHRSKADLSRVAKVDGAAVVVPELGFEAHQLVVDWFASLADGAEAQFYTPAMWQRARIVAEMLSRLLSSSRPSAQLYTAIQQDMKSLLVDAGELRRLGIEVQAAVLEPVAGSNVIDWASRARSAPSASA
jgi:hypothetical protein